MRQEPRDGLGGQNRMEGLYGGVPSRHLHVVVPGRHGGTCYCKLVVSRPGDGVVSATVASIDGVAIVATIRWRCTVSAGPRESGIVKSGGKVGRKTPR